MSAALKNNRNIELVGFVLIAVTIMVVLPLLLDNFRLNLVGKYLTYAFVAVGLVLCWGYTGILSLGQGVFFGLGGYCMAAFLKLEASSVANTKIQSTPGIPDFMDWNQITQLPLFWKPFQSFPLTILAILLVPAIFAFIIVAAQAIRLTKLGRILVAMREQEDRVRFSGYSVANFKIFAFCAAAVFAAIGGAMFTLEIGFMSPSFVGIVPSIEMVIYTAVGGRMSIFGAIWGSLLVNFAKTSLSESFPQLWLFGLGALFIAVVLAFPNGLSGIWSDYVQPRIDRLLASRKSKPKNGWSDDSVADGAPAE